MLLPMHAPEVVHPPQSILRQVSTAKKKGRIPRHRPWFRYKLKGNASHLNAIEKSTTAAAGAIETKIKEKRS